MSAAADFHSQVASIMEVLANAAVAEICRAVDEGYAVVQLEVSRSQKENELLRRKMRLLELQVARYRAERARTGAEGFPGVRLLHRHSRDSAAGPSLQTRTRFLNRSPTAQPVKLDQDPDQEVVTTTGTESAEPEEEEAELLIVKVEGAMETGPVHHEAQSPRGAAAPPVSSPSRTGGRHGETEVSGSDAAVTPATDSGRDCLRRRRLLASHARAAAPLCGDATSKPPQSGVIIIDGGETEPGGPPEPFHPVGRRRSGSPTAPCGGPESEPERSSPGGLRPSFHRAAAAERPYGCTGCPKRFFLEADLLRHAARHRRHKPYGCSLCGKSFVCRSQLDVHRYVHTGERPFACRVCSRRFSHPSNLKRHQKIQHEGQGALGGPGALGAAGPPTAFPPVPQQDYNQ